MDPSRSFVPSRDHPDFVEYGAAKMTSIVSSTERPPGPRGLENLRLLHLMFSDLAAGLDELNSTFGPICQLGIPGVRIVVVGAPDLIHEMTSMKAETFRWNHKFNVIGVRFVVGKRSMIVSDGADHRRRRGSVQRAFTRPRLNSWAQMIVDRTDKTLDLLLDQAVQADQTDQAIDLYPVGRDLILGVTLHAFFGEHLAKRVEEFSQLFLRAQAFIEAPGIHQLPHPIPFTSRSRVRADRRRIDQIIDEEMADRRASPTGNPLDILEVLARDNTLTDDEIRDQVDTLIGAGYDTTASTFAWLLWRTALEPEVWSRLRNEADEILGPIDEPHQSADGTTVGRLEYAGRVVHESLRLHPAGLIGARVAAKRVRFGEYTIEKGTMIAWSPYLVGRDPDVWTDPATFDPDRYLDMTDQQKAMSGRSWIPFGRGPHMCLGFALAQMELTLMIARFAQRLDLLPIASKAPRPVGLVVNRPAGGAPFHVSAR